MNRNASSGPGSHTPDGCSVELYRRLVDQGEAAIIHAAAPRGCDILELGAGTGRVTRVLAALGHRVTAVDYCAEMLAEIDCATTICADIVALDLGRTFACVVLGSYLVNVVEPELRAAFLATCVRHASRDTIVLIEAHDRSILTRAKPGPIASDDRGFTFSWREVTTTGNTLTGTVESANGADTWTQTFSAEIFDELRLRIELANSGLRLQQYVHRNWVEVRA